FGNRHFTETYRYEWLVQIAAGRPPIICKILYPILKLQYEWGMSSLASYLEDLLRRGRSYFSKEEAMKALGQSSDPFLGAAGRLMKRGRLARPKQGFYLILQPADQIAGAPDPALWI